MHSTTTAMLVVLVLALGACGTGDDAVGSGDGTGTDGVEADLSGRLAGDGQLEGGCAWLEPTEDGFPQGVDRDRVEPLWPEGYRVEFGPVRLLDPDGEVVAEEGDVVHVNGQVDPEVATICQVGQPFVVTDVVGTG